tara:strand:+ start:833 stop:1156 length:324 start_codon:yes stop_codon:yes gene_type:complete
MSWQLVLKIKRQGKSAQRNRIREAIKEYIDNHVEFDKSFRTNDIVIDWEEIEVDKPPSHQVRAVGKQLKNLFDIERRTQIENNGYYLERVNLGGAQTGKMEYYKRKP